MDNSGFQKIREIEFAENSPRPPGAIRPRMFRQAMIKDRDNNIYAVYGDRLKKGKSQENTRPFDIIEFDGEKGKVWPGTVAGIMPSNLFSGGKLAEFNAGSGLMKWKCKCLTDGKQITSVQIVVDASDPPAQTLVPSALPAEAWFLFGLTFEGTVYRTLGPGNPSVTLNQAIVTDKTSAPPPGVPGVDRWYRIYIG
jgi:hypothetical protein